MNDHMRTIRFLLIACLTTSLAISGICPSIAAVPLGKDCAETTPTSLQGCCCATDQDDVCCCRSEDGPRCGTCDMACCANPTTPRKDQPPKDNSSRNRIEPHILNAVATSFISSSPSTARFAGLFDVGLRLPAAATTLQALHIRLDV